MSRNLAIALIAFGIILTNAAYLKDVVTGEFDGLIYVGWKAWLGIVLGIAATVAGCYGLMQAPKRAA